ncbi:unnamed protein product, partial [Adineta steineri]
MFRYSIINHSRWSVLSSLISRHSSKNYSPTLKKNFDKKTFDYFYTRRLKIFHDNQQQMSNHIRTHLESLLKTSSIITNLNDLNTKNTMKNFSQTLTIEQFNDLLFFAYEHNIKLDFLIKRLIECLIPMNKTISSNLFIEFINLLVLHQQKYYDYQTKNPNKILENIISSFEFNLTDEQIKNISLVDLSLLCSAMYRLQMPLKNQNLLDYIGQYLINDEKKKILSAVDKQNFIKILTLSNYGKISIANSLTNRFNQSFEQHRKLNEHSTIQDKLQTLQQNVTIITEQKNRMEQMFQSDKRKLKTENEELKKLLEETKAENIIIKEKSDHEIKELKKQLRQSQRDHERETADHNVMVRELQTILSTERNKSETMEHQYDECRAKVVTLESQYDTLKKQYNNLNTQYQTKVNELKDKDSIDVEELKRSKEKVVELTTKIKDLEAKYTEQLRVESKRNQQLEKKLTDNTTEYAQRTSTNETHIAELSEQIGVIEKQRAQDQMAIQRLKERIAQLDVENSLLTKASSASIEQDDIGGTNDDSDNHHDLDTLLKHISKLKVLIRVANDRFGKSLTIEDVLNIDREISSGAINGSNLSSENNKILHIKCHEEIDRLKG